MLLQKVEAGAVEDMATFVAALEEACLHDQGTIAKACNANGMTLLHLAAKRGFNDIGLVLLRRTYKLNADVDHRAKNGCTPLHFCAQSNATALAAKLLQRAATVSIRAQHNFTALHIAAAENHAEMISLLLQHAADPSDADDVIFKQTNSKKSKARK